MLDFIDWVGKKNEIDFTSQQIGINGIPEAHGENSQILVAVMLSDQELIVKNNGIVGHVVVLNAFILYDNSYTMKFGDPSMESIMYNYSPSTFTSCPPKEISCWAFYKINITRP